MRSSDSGQVAGPIFKSTLCRPLMPQASLFLPTGALRAGVTFRYHGLSTRTALRTAPGSRLCPGRRQPSGSESPDPSTGGDNQKATRGAGGRSREAGHEASWPEALNCAFPCPGVAFRTASDITREVLMATWESTCPAPGAA